MATAKDRGKRAPAAKRAAKKTATRATPATATKTATRATPAATKKTATRATPATATKSKPVPAALPMPAPAPAPAAKGAKVAKPPKAAAKPPRVDAKKKARRIRDSFAMPEADHVRIARLKDTAKRAGLKVKKNELLRLGLRALQMLPSAELQERILALRLPEGGAKR